LNGMVKKEKNLGGEEIVSRKRMKYGRKGGSGWEKVSDWDETGKKCREKFNMTGGRQRGEEAPDKKSNL